MISTGQLLIILVIALIIFGPKRLPELGKTVGKALKNFKDSMNGLDEEAGSSSPTAPVDHHRVDTVMKEPSHDSRPEEEHASVSKDSK